MTIPLIITICALLIVAYVADISSAKTRIPSVVLLLVLGWILNQLVLVLVVPVPDLIPILPIFGTIGLVLIVLEGSLELELNKSKLPFVRKVSIIAFLPMLLFSAALAFAFAYFGNATFKVGLANAIPFAVISSAIAIPSAQHLVSPNKEFVTYESSLSDIFGVIFFNFITMNDNIGTHSFGHFFLEVFAVLVISFFSTIALAFLLSKIRHHVKFTPIIMMVILIYAVSKYFHLPALIFILLFGLFLGNIDEIKNTRLIQHIKPDILKKEVHKLRELTIEMAFLIRALFFILFGYLIQTAELLNTGTMAWAAAITFGIFAIRYLFLKLFKLPVFPLLTIAPRGLITILLFLNIPVSQSMPLANKSLVIQVIVLSALVMMVGLMTAETGGENGTSPEGS